jgi:LacI family transcriptional regulator
MKVRASSVSNIMPTIDDVARLAAVGRTTVSRVLNNKPNVREEVRLRVMAAVEQLDFKVNLQARNLAGRAAKRVVLIHASDFDTEPNSYYSSAIELGATRAAVRLGVQLTTHIVNQNDPEAASAIANLVREVRADGLVLTPPFSDNADLVRSIQALACKVVCIAGGAAMSAITATLGIDDRQASYEIGRYLVAEGHHRFGFVHGLRDHVSAESRFSGFLAALAEAGFGEDDIVTERGNFTFRSGLDCAQRILAQANRPTAIACANDDMAAGALLAAHKAGFEIPKDVAITGFDDTPVSEIVWPPLTTVHQPLRRMGERAVEQLIQASDGISPSLELIEYRLIIRESTQFCG